MNILGIELSSKQGSVAVLRDGELLAEQTWMIGRLRHGVLFQALETLLREAHISYNDISLYAVGRGPGSFSGMRMAFAAAQALALPSKTEVRAVSSGAALALQVAQAPPPAKERQTRASAPQQIAVVGDARRSQVWIGFFQALETGGVNVSNDWKLIPYDEVVVPEGTVVVSPEAERLEEIFPTIGKPQFPHAKEVAELALMQTEPEPLEPLYMHPPVFVKPKIV